VQGTVDEVLEQHGFSGRQLLGLARKAANDALRRHGAFLDDQRYDELVSYMLEVGCRYAPRYERGHGIAIQTYLYRTMRRRYTDCLRMTLGDTRHTTAKHRHPAGGFVSLDESDGPTWDDLEQESLGEVAETMGDALGLTAKSRWVLVEIVVRLAEGAPPLEAAAEAGLAVQRANRLVEDLCAELEQHGVNA
jgi:hypothetical protein